MQFSNLLQQQPADIPSAKVLLILLCPQMLLADWDHPCLVTSNALDMAMAPCHRMLSRVGHPVARLALCANRLWLICTAVCWGCAEVMYSTQQQPIIQAAAVRHCHFTLPPQESVIQQVSLLMQAP